MATIEQRHRAPQSRVVREDDILRASRLVHLRIEYIPSSGIPSESGGDDWGTIDELIADVQERQFIDAAEESRMFAHFHRLKQEADELRQRIVPTDPSPPLIDAAERILQRADHVRNALACVYRRLVISAARGFINPANPLDELTSEGNITLLRALDIFDFTRGNRFSTYLINAIRHNLYRYVMRKRNSRLVLSEFASAELVAARPKSRADEARQERIFRRLCSLLSQLCERDRAVLEARFGLGDHPEARTLQHVADELGVSRERVRQVESRALKRLRALVAPAMDDLVV